MPGQERGWSNSARRGTTLPIFGPAGLLGVAAAYYLGALLGFELRFPPATTSVLWPPNAILTAALLLAPPRRWWRVLLAILPAHFAAEMQAGLPVPLVGALFVTNCAEALLAAGLVRRWSDAPDRFDSLHRVLVFLAGAVLLAPLVTTFLDAWAVHALRGEPFATVVLRRLFSNVLTELVVVPSSLALVREAVPWFREATRRRRLEVALLAVGHVAVGGLVLHAYHGSFDLPGGAFTALPLLMPLLVLAAARFGPAGASLSLLATALLATGTAVSHAPGLSLAVAEDRVRALQVFLTVVGAPLLCLSALVEERRRAVVALRERLRFEELVSRIAGNFVHVPGHEMGRAFPEALERLAKFLRVDQAALWGIEDGRGALSVVSRWPPPEAEGRLADPKETVLPAALTGPLLGNEPLVCADADGQASGRSAGKELAQRLGARSLLALPVVAGGQVVGSLTLICASDRRTWPESQVEGALLVADVFASALARQRAEGALRASETMNSAVLASLTSGVAVLDRGGRIIAVNDAFVRLLRESGVQDVNGVGDNYLDLYRSMPESRAQHALEAWRGIDAVLTGRASTSGGEYAYSSPSGERWVHLTVVPLHRPEGGAVLTYTDVTERRLAETQANRLREEMAQFLRRSTIGELTSSIAHDLNQPLAAILANAQAGRRLMKGPTGPARDVVLDEILGDIISENQRAANVIRGVRRLLREGEPDPEEMDLNTIVQEVLRLTANDLSSRAVTLRCTLDPDRLPVLGNRVRLQQVLLNLLLNALEAMAEQAAERVICVRTERRPPGTAVVRVKDTGPGLALHAEADIFLPFYTTKARGMGMGLSIARSIVEAHAGTITARTDPQGGAVFTFTLPLSKDTTH